MKKLSATAAALALALLLLAGGPAGPAPRIVFLGDSLTAGGDWTEWYPGLRVFNLGVSGDAVEQVRRRTARVRAARPDKVFVMAGINDLAAGRTPPATAAGYDLLLEDLSSAAPGAELFVLSVLPVNMRLTEGRLQPGRVQDLNRRLQSLAEKRGARYIDLTPHLADDQGELRADFTFDGVHLNRAGYRAWRRGLAPHLPGPDSPSSGGVQPRSGPASRSGGGSTPIAFN